MTAAPGILPAHFHCKGFVCYLDECRRPRHGQHIFCPQHWHALSTEQKHDMAMLQFAVACSILSGDQLGYNSAIAAAENYLAQLCYQLQDSRARRRSAAG